MREVRVREPGYFSVKSLAAYLACSQGTIWRNWVEWKEKYKINPIRLNGKKGGKASLRIKRSEINRMLELW